MSKQVIRLSKRLSWLLRHNPEKGGVVMDEAGWVPIPDVLHFLGTSREVLDRVVAENNKQRLQVRGLQIRCVQGHSTEGTPVTAEALEASWEVLDPAITRVWHGTHPAAALAIASSGIQPMQRTHVHLAVERDATVGKRANVALMLGVDRQKLLDCGVELFCAPNRVVLCREVPAAAIVEVVPCTAKGRAMQSEVEEAFGLR